MNNKFAIYGIIKPVLLTCLLLFLVQTTYSQVGISVSPPRLYYQLKAGETGTQEVLVSNISKDHTMSLSLTFGDWEYDNFGNNVILPPDSLENSCASWLSVAEGTYLTLEPGEHREIELMMTVPEGNAGRTDVHTAMLYVTQMNSVDGVDADGAAIKVNVRQGIKIYYSDGSPEERALEIEALSFDKENNALELGFANYGNIWINGTVSATIFNQSNGKETVKDEIVFYTLPGDKRTMFIPIGATLEKGEYIATVIIDYGDDTTLEAAELQFSHE